MIDLSVLVTESRNKETMGLDQMTPLEIEIGRAHV